jgi:hypothetical protein
MLDNREERVLGGRLMTRTGASILTLLLVLSLSTACATADEGKEEMGKKLEVGDVAPTFELPGSDGKTYRLEDYTGKQVVVLAWFPKAFTGG